MNAVKDLWPALLLSGILLAVGFGAAYVNLAEGDYLIVIHFDSYRGIDFFGTRAHVFGILWLGAALNIINFTLAAIFRRREKFLTHLLSWFSVFLSLLILIAVAVIISIN